MHLARAVGKAARFSLHESVSDKDLRSITAHERDAVPSDADGDFAAADGDVRLQPSCERALGTDQHGTEKSDGGSVVIAEYTRARVNR